MKVRSATDGEVLESYWASYSKTQNVASALPLDEDQMQTLVSIISLLFHILIIIMQHSVLSRLYTQSSISFLSTVFSSKQENYDSKNDVIKIIKIIYAYI